MSNVLKKQNISIVVSKYADKRTGEEKKQWKTVGELITMQGNNGEYQFGELWGPGGVTEFKVYDQKERDSAMQTAGAAPQDNDRSFSDDVPF